MQPFSYHRQYSLKEITKIATQNGMTVIDCLKDEGIISLEGFDGKDLSGENVFEFNHVKSNFFILKWFRLDWQNYI